MDIYALYGRLAETHQALLEKHDEESTAHRATIALLRQVTSGALPPGRVLVGPDDRWQILPEEAVAKQAASHLRAVTLSPALGEDDPT